MKLGQIISERFTKSLETVMRLSGVPPKTAFKLRGILKKIGVETEKYEDLRKQYLKEFADKDESGEPVLEGNSYKISKENMTLFAIKMADLGALDISLSEIKLDDFGTTANLTVEDIFRLEFIVE